MNQMMNTVKMLSIQLSKNIKNKKTFGKMIYQIERIKGIENDEIFWDSFTEIMNSKNYLFPMIKENCIINNLFPKEPKDMNGRLALKVYDDFYIELRWMVFLFSTYSQELSIFIENRKKFDTYILLGRYSEALDVLDIVESKFGISFWLVESKLFLYNKIGRNSAQIFDYWPDGINKAITRFYELKNQKNRTNDEYQHIVKKEIAAYRNLEPSYPFLKDVIPYYNYRLSPLTYELNEANALSVLKSASTNSLIDCYLLCLEIFKTALITRQDSRLYSDVKKCIGMFSVGQDEQLEALQFCFSDKNNRTKYTLKSKLEYAKEAFICGDLNRCREQTLTIVKKTPFNIQALNLLVETNILLNIDEEKEFEGTILGELINSLMIVYPMRRERDEEIDEIYKVLNCCSQSCWAPLVANAIANRCRLVNSEAEIITRKIESAQYLDIETVCNCLVKDEAIQFVKVLENKSVYIDLREALLSEDYDKAYNICSLKELKHLFAVCNPAINIQEKRNHLESVKEKGGTFEILISKYFFIQLDLEKDFVTALEFAVDLMICNIFTTLFIPIDQLINCIETMGSEISSNICVPILYYIKYRCYSREVKAEVCAACEDFLFFSHINLPSEIDALGSKWDNRKVVFFLRYVCTTEILSTALAAIITNSFDLAQERLDVCLILCKKDPENAKIYEQEMRNITQKKKINSELRIIQENRIHVNVEGMRQDLIDNYKNDFSRFLLYKEKDYKEILDTLEILIQQTQKQNIILIERNSEIVLRELICNIRDAFVSSNEYGLDGYLSLNIRHGAISDALRGPLSAAGLLTVYNSKSGEFELNTMWNCNDINDDDNRLILHAIESFTNETDAIIEDLRTKYIRIRTEKTNTEGIFNYIISEEEYGRIFESSNSFDEIDEFLNYMFDFLWVKTEANLAKMKELLKGEIKDRYEKAFLTLKNSISEVKDRNKTAGMLRTIVEATNDMPNTIDRVCFWFQRSTESKHTDFDLDFVFDMSLETIGSMHPDTQFVPVKMENSDIDSKIEGKYLKPYSDIFYNLLDNIYKNATRKERNKVQVEYRLMQKDVRRDIYLQNDFDCSINHDEEKKKLDELRTILDNEEYLTRVKGEGGTGIPKIGKIISVDLKKRFKIDFGFIEEKNKFFIKVFMF